MAIARSSTSSYGEEIPTLNLTAKIQGTIYLFFGNKDHYNASRRNSTN